MRRILLSASLLATLGCVAAPPYRPPEIAPAVPERWTAGSEGTVPEISDNWWTTLGDPKLDVVVREALANNQDLRRAEARVGAAAAQARIAGADLYPSVDVGLQAGRSKQNFIGFPIPGSTDDVLSTTYTRYGVSLDVRWEVDLWGRLRARARAGLADFEAGSADLVAARLSIAGQTAKAWFALAEARRQLELAEETVLLFRQTAQRVSSRYDVGLRPSLDVRLAESDVAAAEAVLEQRKDALQRTRRQLELLLGRYPGGEVEGVTALPPPVDEVPAGLPAELVSRRPDLVAAERRLRAADARLVEARRSLYPRFTLTGSGGSSSNELGDLLDGDFSVWSFAAGLLQPLFQGGRLRAGIDLAEASVDDAAAAYVQEALQAFAEVETALAAERILDREEQALARAAKQARAARTLSEDRYVAGLTDIITLLDAQRRSLTAESAWLAVRRQRIATRIDLFLALGGGFEAADVVGEPEHEEKQAS